MMNILYLPSTYLLSEFTSLQTGFARICFRCMIVQNMEWENSCLLILLLVIGERIKVHVMKISFKHGWFSHRARSSNFRIHLVTAFLCMALNLPVKFLINQFLPQLFFRFSGCWFQFLPKRVCASCWFGSLLCCGNDWSTNFSDPWLPYFSWKTSNSKSKSNNNTNFLSKVIPRL